MSRYESERFAYLVRRASAVVAQVCIVTSFVGRLVMGDRLPLERCLGTRDRRGHGKASDRGANGGGKPKSAKPRGPGFAEVVEADSSEHREPKGDPEREPAVVGHVEDRNQPQ